MKGLRLKGVTKVYEGSDRTALESVDLEVTPGEFVAVVGPSGCGKSTLLRIVAGLESLSAGELWIGERRVEEVPPGGRGVGMVFQDYALYPHMSVRGNLLFGLRSRRLPAGETERRIQDAARMLRIEEYLERRPSQLSGGQRQRVAIARALVKQPDLFLFDEPLSNLDAKLRAQTRQEIATLHRKIRSTTLYVTHDQEEAMTLADRIVVLSAGRVQQIGTPMDVYHRPANRFVASFIGNPGMNFLVGAVERRAGRASFSTEAGEIPVADSAPSGRAILGFRPESAWVHPLGDGSHRSACRGQVTLLEVHGHDGILRISLAGESIAIRTARPELLREWKEWEPGTWVGLDVDPHAMHWFQADGESPGLGLLTGIFRQPSDARGSNAG